VKRDTKEDSSIDELDKDLEKLKKQGVVGGKLYRQIKNAIALQRDPDFKKRSKKKSKEGYIKEKLTGQYLGGDSVL